MIESNDEIEVFSSFCGVVSLLDMLRFYAEKFVRLARDLGSIHSDFEHGEYADEADTSMPAEDVPDALKHLMALRDVCVESLLTSAVDQAERMIAAMRSGGTARQFMRLADELQNRIDDELARKIIYCIESDRTSFCDPKWLSDSVISKAFPTAFKELQSAGRCYAFGEGPASAFHSMRALEVALGTLAVRFEVDFEHTNWQPVIEGIESKIREIGKNQTKTQQIRDDEKFFGGLARHFMFLKNGWRNHVIHVRESYTDREARQMLDHVTDLLTDMSSQLAE